MYECQQKIEKKISLIKRLKITKKQYKDLKRIIGNYRGKLQQIQLLQDKEVQKSIMKFELEKFSELQNRMTYLSFKEKPIIEAILKTQIIKHGEALNCFSHQFDANMQKELMFISKQVTATKESNVLKQQGIVPRNGPKKSKLTTKFLSNEEMRQSVFIADDYTNVATVGEQVYKQVDNKTQYLIGPKELYIEKQIDRKNV